MTTRRGWFIRGDNDDGINRISTWIRDGYVSLGWHDTSAVEVGMTKQQMKDAFAVAEPTWDDWHRGAGAAKIERFINQASEGDLVATKDRKRSAVYIGVITGPPRKLGSAESGAMWQRDVNWIDPERPHRLDGLPDALRTFFNTRGDSIREVITPLEELEHVAGDLSTPPDGWSEFIYWAGRIWSDPSFDAEERDYKIEAARVLAEARLALASGGDWLGLLKAGLGGQNNLIDWRARGSFIDWCTTNPGAAERALAALWNVDEVTAETVDAFVRDITTEKTTGKLSIASVLLLGLDHQLYPPFRARVDESVRRLAGIAARATPLTIEDDAVPEPNELASRLGISGLAVRNYLRRAYARPAAEHGDRWRLDRRMAEAVIEHFQQAPNKRSPGERYMAFLDLVDEFTERITGSGVTLRDRLDGQSLLWWVSAAPPPEDWSDDDRAAFLRFQRGEEASVEAQRPTLIAPVTEDLASRLFLPRAWLQEAVDLLVEKRQVIFYGPPGTGKTFVARAIGDHIVATGGACQLVQFHPAYSYEDFFEGYRPSSSGESGGLHFTLQKGPLRRIAEQAAAHPDIAYLLVIDEINRGNIAKIFGELYFLLEYRDEPIRLQYSPDDPFQLPENLLFIGTMNTADRSIALVDSALRRRFYFYPFLPRERPVRDVLAAWLDAAGHDPHPAVLLRALNDALHEELPDDEFSIGPSYLIPKSGSAPDLDRVWRYAIRPLLEERFYGARTTEEIERDFGLAAMRRRASGTEPEPLLEDDVDA